MDNDLEFRSFTAEYETREEGDEGIIVGRPVVYGQTTKLPWFDETIAPGALDGTDLTDVRLCLNHDTDYVYARSRRNTPGSTMTLVTDARGMEINARLNTKGSPKAQDLYSAVSRGDISGMSFMFSVADDKWEDLDTERPKRTILKIRSVVEVSAVTFPAYTDTSISARSETALENARRELENARKRNAEQPEGGDKANELELEKERLKIIGG